ncbi:PepSY-associated TM helix domain-containing protein [Flammeovirga kamogawensis]|uniref:PepSY domain-containing protein n=1 Tax=Flammeovirga kamogawensis TaxID=373891 RepID=A0ABX8GZA8_9BACT|nr:PepSY-associated TM helix domain-containing protein [Flammeovirga kamogawensis]MBB6459118.1 hypothetical protein [Flammeovirga kamogawensis]QWG08687.1 PepSY domain-containing protein [Flammeovirga kamogawensis]TRX66980.1 PepSY domain-containing protein [Flammeovirga kamogawensis]
MSKLGKSIYKKVQKWHKYIGISISIVLVWMSISGILLNHPNLIAGVGVNQNFIPDDYLPQNWNRGGILDAVHIGSDTIFLAGKQGIWKSINKGKSFSSAMNNGFPEEIFYQKTNDLLYLKHENSLFAATFGGVYKLNLLNNKWCYIPTKSSNKEQFVKLLKVKNNLFAVSQSGIYLYNNSTLLPQNLLKDKRTTMNLIQFTFALHSGWLWGTTGRVIYDFVALILIFLSITSLYITFRKKVKIEDKTKRKKRNNRLGFMIKYHTQIGVWTSLILLIIGGTGLFMRPPLLVALVGGKVPLKYIPSSINYNPWYHTIRNALYDKKTDRIVFDTTEGIYEGNSNLESSFTKTDWDVNIFVMGATVFEPLANGHFLIGSFYGLFDYQRGDNFSIDVITNLKTPKYSSLQRPSDYMVMSHFSHPDSTNYITTFQQGLLALNQPKHNSYYAVPHQLIENYRMPLWNYMFELHNGRLFHFFMNKWGILFIPLISLLFIILTISGVYEYGYRKKSKIKKFFKKH